jgi:hypothetical protein
MTPTAPSALHVAGLRNAFGARTVLDDIDVDVADRRGWPSDDWEAATDRLRRRGLL